MAIMFEVRNGNIIKSLGITHKDNNCNCTVLSYEWKHYKDITHDECNVLFEVMNRDNIKFLEIIPLSASNICVRILKLSMILFNLGDGDE